MSEDNHQEKNEKKQQRESFEAWCRRLGIKLIREKGGMEFSPYHGPRKAEQLNED